MNIVPLSTQNPLNHIKEFEKEKRNLYEILTDILTHLAKCNKIQKQIKDIHKIKRTEYKVNGMMIQTEKNVINVFEKKIF